MLQVWDAESNILLGHTLIELAPLLRQQKRAVHVARAYDVVAHNYSANDEPTAALASPHPSAPGIVRDAEFVDPFRTTLETEPTKRFYDASSTAPVGRSSLKVLGQLQVLMSNVGAEGRGLDKAFMTPQESAAGSMPSASSLGSPGPSGWVPFSGLPGPQGTETSFASRKQARKHRVRAVARPLAATEEGVVDLLREQGAGRRQGEAMERKEPSPTTDIQLSEYDLQALRNTFDPLHVRSVHYAEFVEFIQTGVLPRSAVERIESGNMEGGKCPARLETLH